MPTPADKPRSFNAVAAQGDVILIRRHQQLPSGLTPVPRVEERLIVAHSETGHHHVIARPRVAMYASDDPLVAWLEVHGDEALPSAAELVHERPFDTHDTLLLQVGVYEVRRQREYTPEGWRRVQD